MKRILRILSSRTSVVVVFSCSCWVKPFECFIWNHPFEFKFYVMNRLRLKCRCHRFGALHEWSSFSKTKSCVFCKDVVYFFYSRFVKLNCGIFLSNEKEKRYANTLVFWLLLNFWYSALRQLTHIKLQYFWLRPKIPFLSKFRAKN